MRRRSRPRADWLRFQIRHAAEPADLWLLRAAVFAALPGREHGAATRGPGSTRHELSRTAAAHPDHKGAGSGEEEQHEREHQRADRRGSRSGALGG